MLTKGERDGLLLRKQTAVGVTGALQTLPRLAGLISWLQPSHMFKLRQRSPRVVKGTQAAVDGLWFTISQRILPAGRWPAGRIAPRWHPTRRSESPRRAGQAPASWKRTADRKGR